MNEIYRIILNLNKEGISFEIVKWNYVKKNKVVVLDRLNSYGDKQTRHEKIDELYNVDKIINYPHSIYLAVFCDYENIEITKDLLLEQAQTIINIINNWTMVLSNHIKDYF